MAMNGDALGDAIAQAMRDEGLLKGDTPEELDAAQEQVKAVWRVVGGAFVDYMTSNAEVTVTITPADVGLQTSTTAGTPTAGPAVAKSLGGEIE